MLEKIVLVTRKTRLQELIERFMSRSQARFYIEHSGGDFREYDVEDRVYGEALTEVKRSIDLGLKVQVIDRSLVPTFLFTEKDLVITLGQDGLVANVAKYARGQPLVGVNPDPARIDGLLLPFGVSQVRRAVNDVLEATARVRRVTLARVKLDDGQELLAFNDLFIGARTHVSARYRLRFGDAAESQSSSGIIVSTGAGSTGWLSSVYNMAAGLSRFAGGSMPTCPALAWEDPRLVFAVREPFRSRHSGIDIAAGYVHEGQELHVESLMPSGGAVFSDGIEADYLEFNAGRTASISRAPSGANLVVTT